MKRQMAVFLKDTEYGTRFVRYLRQLPRFAYEVVYFSEEKACKEFLQKQGVELFIFSGEEEFESHLLDQASKVIYLSDKERTASIKNINPFQSMEHICLQIWPDSAQFQDNIQEKQNSNAKTSIITLLNLEGMLEKMDGTSLLTEALKDQKDIILVDFSQFAYSMQQESKGMELNTSYGLSDVLYYLSSNELDLGLLERFITKNKGVSRIHPVNHCLDVMEFTREQINQLLELIHLSGYQTIVAIVSVITDATITLLEQSKSILSIQRESEGNCLFDRVKKQLSDLLSEEGVQTLKVLSVKGEKDMVIQLRKGLVSFLGSCL